MRRYHIIGFLHKDMGWDTHRFGRIRMSFAGYMSSPEKKYLENLATAFCVSN